MCGRCGPGALQWRWRLLPALALLVGSIVSTPDHQSSFNASEWFASVLDDAWPQRGCAESGAFAAGAAVAASAASAASAAGAGSASSAPSSVERDASLELRCALAAGRVRITADADLPYFGIACQNDSGGRAAAGRFHCEELEQHAGTRLRLLWRQRHREGVGGKTGQKPLRLHVDHCELLEPLSCVQRLLGFPIAIGELELRDVPPPINAEYFNGLTTVNSLVIDNAQVDQSGLYHLPYEALGALPALERLAVRGGGGGGAGAVRLARGWRPALRLRELRLHGPRALPPRAFDGLPLLRDLQLVGNDVETISNLTFLGLSKLEYLAMDFKSLESLPPGLLVPTLSLRVLRVQHSALRALPRHLLRHLRHLQEVVVENTRELELEAETFANLTLHTLRLVSCGVSAVAGGLVRGSPLRALSLRHNALATLPGALLAGQHALRSLDLGHNRLRTLSPTLFSDAQALVDLRLDHNAIEYLPNAVFRRLSHLELLDLTNNRIRQLSPQMFSGLKNISELYVSHNPLWVDTAGAASAAATTNAGAGRCGHSPLGALRSLRRLELRATGLRCVMLDWRSLPHLQYLDLSRNNISELRPKDMEFVSEVTVNLGFNDIERFINFEREAAPSFSRTRFLLAGSVVACNWWEEGVVRVLAAAAGAGLQRLALAGVRCRTPLRLTRQGDAPPAPLHSLYRYSYPPEPNY